jgi:ASCH domain
MMILLCQRSAVEYGVDGFDGADEKCEDCSGVFIHLQDFADPNEMRALSIRQPFAELILRGIKTVEYRTRPTRIIGERFFIYASRGGTEARRHGGTRGNAIWSEDLQMANPPEWMVELAEQIRMIPPGTELPRGVIVGSAVIARCEALECEARRHEGTEARRGERGTQGSSVESSLMPSPLVPPSCLSASVPSCLYQWHLADIQRAKTFRKPTKHPQPVWFNPF